MENIGAFALILAFALCLYALVAALAGQWTHRPVLVASAGRAVTALWVSLTVAIGALVVLFQQDSFHVANVAAHSNVTMPAIYKLSALWSGQEGSLLFWSWLLACYGVIAVRLNRRHLPELQPLRHCHPDGGARLFSGTKPVCRSPVHPAGVRDFRWLRPVRSP